MKRSSDSNYEKTVDDFIDPVTLDFFKTPVVASNGRTYELDTLQGRRKQCLNNIDVCRDPLIREPLDRLARYDTDLVDETTRRLHGIMKPVHLLMHRKDPVITIIVVK